MSLVYKIPPLVSALAFGYGVGMAAPEGAVQHVQTTVQAGMRPVASHQAGPAPLPLSLEERLRGPESSSLARLRGANGGSRFGDSCDLPDERRNFTRERRTSNIEDEEQYDEEIEEFDSAETAALSRLQLPDLGLGVSRSALRYVKFFTKTDRGRGMFETWMKRSGRYQDLVQDEFRARNLPEDLIWVAMIESGFDPTAKSPAGAVGLWQFMPATGAVYGLRQNKFVDQRRNPVLATRAAAHHLRDLYLRFGQWDLALAAYNMGYEQLLDRIDRVGSTDFNELVRRGVMPSETSKYVPKILAAAIVANNLERFDFDRVEPSRPVDVGELAVPPRTPLDILAKAAGVSTSTIRKLNPDILGKEVPPGKGDILVNIPPEAVSRTMAALPAMLRMEGKSADDDIVDPLDLMNPDGFRPPQDEDKSLLSFLPPPKKKRRALREPMVPSTSDDIAIEDSKPRSGRETLVYRITPGDTLIGVARQFAMDVEDVARDNNLEPGEALREGGLLKLRVRKDLLDDKASKGDGGRTAAKKPSKRG